MEAGKRRLQQCSQRLSLDLVTKEMQVLSRLLYRNKSQHRREIAYQKSVRVIKEVSKYQSAGLQNSIKSLIKALTGSEQKKGSTQQCMLVKQHEAIVFMKLLQCAQFLAKLIEFTESAFSTVDQMLYFGHFVSYNLIVAASLSRLWYCLCYHLVAVSGCYDAMRVPSFSLSNLQELPHSVSDVLGKQYKRYLSNAIRKVQSVPRDSHPASDTAQLSSISQTCDGEPKLLKSRLGVPVVLDESQLAARERELTQAPQLTHRLKGQPLHSSPEHDDDDDDDDDDDVERSLSSVKASLASQSKSKAYKSRLQPKAYKSRLQPKAYKSRLQPNMMVIVVRTQTGRVVRVKLRSRQLVSQVLGSDQKRATVSATIKNDLPWMRKLPRRLECCGLQLNIVDNLPNKASWKRHTLAQRARTRANENCGKKWSVQKLQKTFADQLEVAAHETEDKVVTSKSQPNSSAESMQPPSDGNKRQQQDIDDIFSAIL